MTEFYKLPRARYVNTCKRNRQICNVEPLHKQKRPWFTAECKRLYNIYHKALAAFNKCKSVENKKFKKKKQPKGNTSVPVQIIWTKEKQEETS